jgi:hypothetical protein
LTLTDNKGKSVAKLSGDKVLTFALLVDYFLVDRFGKHKSREHAFLPLYTFAGDDWNFITEYEVYGRLAFKAKFQTPDDAWIKGSAPAKKRHEVLRLRTTLFPDRNQGAAARELDFLKIFSLPITAAGRLARRDLDQLGLERYLTNEAIKKKQNEIGSMGIALKQVRNAIHCEDADYQSLVGVPRVFSYSDNSKVTHRSVRVEILRDPNFPILAKLGLKGIPPGAGDFDVFEGEALTVNGKLKQSPGRELWRRVAGKDIWRNVPDTRARNDR